MITLSQPLLIIDHGRDGDDDIEDGDDDNEVDDD